MKKLLWLLLPALAAYGAWDLVREVRGAWTSDYSRTYSRAVGQTMSRAFDSLNLSGRGVRIGVLDAGFGGFRTDRWTRGLHVAAWRAFPGGGGPGGCRHPVPRLPQWQRWRRRSFCGRTSRPQCPRRARLPRQCSPSKSLPARRGPGPEYGGQGFWRQARYNHNTGCIRCLRP